LVRFWPIRYGGRKWLSPGSEVPLSPEESFLGLGVFVRSAKCGLFPMLGSHRRVAAEKLLSVGENPKSAGYITSYVFYGCVDGIWQAFGKSHLNR
jgi:hypothetical protein